MSLATVWEISGQVRVSLIANNEPTASARRLRLLLLAVLRDLVPDLDVLTRRPPNYLLESADLRISRWKARAGVFTPVTTLASIHQDS